MLAGGRWLCGNRRGATGERALTGLRDAERTSAAADSEVAGRRARAVAARAEAREVAHWCEALANATPSPFLPLHVPRQPRPVHVQEQAGAPAAAPARPPRSFFRRPLAEGTVAFSSERGRAMLGEVMGVSSGGVREGGDAFLEIMTAFEMQRNPVSCGLASLTIALNVLKLAPWRNEGAIETRRGSCSGADEDEFDMVTEDELVQVLLKQEEKQELANVGVSLEGVCIHESINQCPRTRARARTHTHTHTHTRSGGCCSARARTASAPATCRGQCVPSGLLH